MTADRPLLVTSALPYANGPLHFGHVAGAYLPADVYVRYQRLRGLDVLFLCGTDEHGVSITVNAEKEGRRDPAGYREYTGRWYHEIKALFDRFALSFDHFSRTSREDPHYALTQEFFVRLLREGRVAPRVEEQHYCPRCERFLPDRYVEGTCYQCGAAARGDECKGCGAWLDAIRLVDPRCATCGSTPQVRETMQYELDLAPFKDDARLGAWLRWLTPRLKSNVRATMVDKMIEGEGLESRPITRDLRWGVPVPATDLDGRPVEGHEGKVLYVWFDAPIGYVSATIEWARGQGDEALWRRYWITAREAGFDEGPRLLHFIGKDNIPFHCIVFPAMLAWQGEAREGETFIGPGPGERWVLPENVPANEFYNLEGRKFSTSDRWMLDSERMFELFGLDAIRWYLTVSMPETADAQFRFGELQARVNAELADTMGNYAARVLKFVGKHFDGVVPEADGAHPHAGDLEAARAAREQALSAVGAALERFEFRAAAAAVVDLARFGNRLFDERAPWTSRKEDPPACALAMHAHVQVLATLSVLLAPFTPGASGRLRAMLGLPALAAHPPGEAGPSPWEASGIPAGHRLGEPGILFEKIPDALVEQESARLGTATA